MNCVACQCTSPLSQIARVVTRPETLVITTTISLVRVGQQTEGVEARAGEVAEVISREMGMPLKAARMIQVGLPQRTFQSYAKIAREYEFESGDGAMRIIREAIGGCGFITPWNYPLHQIAGRERDADEIGDYRGLAWHRPAVAGAFTVALLSLAGIPLTGGFIGKFYLFAAGADSALWPLLIVFVVSSVLGLFYYLRVVGAMFASPLEAGTRGFLRRPPLLSLDTLVLITLAGIVIWLGVYPSPLIHLVQSI